MGQVGHGGVLLVPDSSRGLGQGGRGLMVARAVGHRMALVTQGRQICEVLGLMSQVLPW